MATTYTSTIEVRCWKEHTCVCCQTIFAYQFFRKVSGQGGTTEKATLNAQAAVKKAVEREVDLQPCPTCGLYQPDMIGQQRAGRHWGVFWLSLIAFAVILILGGTHVIQWNAAIWSSTIACGLAALMLCAADLKNLNRDLMANQQRAQEQISLGTMMIGQAGKYMPGAEETALPRRSMFHQLVLALVVGSVVLAASPEIMRMSKGWPLNDECYPPVVGPGDKTQIYMNDKITSIKGYWRGMPNVVVFEEGKEQTAQAARAEANQKDWGTTISAKSSEKNTSKRPWVRVTMPPDPKLGGKRVICDIELCVEYPQMSVGKSFNTVGSNMRKSLPLNFAPAGAGGSYSEWWWEGTLVAMGLIVAGSVVLAMMARGLRRMARPTRALVMTDPSAQPPQGDIPIADVQP